MAVQRLRRGPGIPVRKTFLPVPVWDPPDPAVPTVAGRVSFIMPAYEAAGTIGMAVYSCFNQTHPIDELVIVEDGSHDQTWELIEQLRQAHGGRLKALRQPNLGVSAARNRAIRHASGEFIFYLDADDLAPPDRVENCLREFAETGADLIYGQKEIFVLDPAVRGPKSQVKFPTPTNIVGSSGFGTSTVAVRRAVHVETGVWLDERMYGGEDGELMIACLEAGLRIHCSEHTLCWVRRGERSLSTRVSWNLMRRYIINKHRVFLSEFIGQKLELMPEEQAELERELRGVGTVRVPGTGD